jgi:hypothetical protein
VTDLPSVPPPITPEAGSLWSQNSQGRDEERFWANEKKLTGLVGTNRIRALTVFGWIVPYLMILFAVLFGVSVSTWALHFLLPTKWHWLNAEQLSKIQSIIFSGALGGIVASYIKTNFLNEKQTDS